MVDVVLGISYNGNRKIWKGKIPMISCVSLNPSIDRTLEVENLLQGGLNRVCKQTDVAAGKGVNVALAVSALGLPCACTGFMYREGGPLFEQRLAAGGVSSDFLVSEGAVRINVKVLDRKRGEITEFNASGVSVSGEQLEQMRLRVLEHAKKSRVLILSGSLPPGCPEDYYRTLARSAAEQGCRVMLDAEGERLRLGLEAQPFLIKPNRYELELLVGRKLEKRDALLEAALECIQRGAGAVAVSLGGEGALMTDGREAYFARGLKVEIKSTVAAGDSMIAGLAAACCREEELAQALRLGVAAATVRCMTPPEKIISREDCFALMEKIEMEKLF